MQEDYVAEEDPVFHPWPFGSCGSARLGVASKREPRHGSRDGGYRHGWKAGRVQLQAVDENGQARDGHVQVKNSGALHHTFKGLLEPQGRYRGTPAPEKGTASIAPGKSTTLSVTFKTKGTYEYLCVIPGHAAGGMKGDLKVT